MHFLLLRSSCDSMKIKSMVPYLLGIMLILAIGYYIGFQSIIDAFKNAKLWLLPVIIISIFIEYYLQVLRANVLFKACGEQVSKGMFKNYAIGQAIAFIMPSRAFGELARVFALKQLLKVQLSKVFAAVSVERILEILIFGIIVIATSFLYSSQVRFAYLVGILFSVAVLFLILMFVSNFVKKSIISITNKLKLKRISNYLSEYITSSKVIIVNKNAMFVAFLYSVLRLFIDFARVWLIFYMFGFSVNFWLIAGIISLSYLLAIVFILPGGLGVFEGGAVAVFTYFGLPSSIAFSGMLVERLLSYWLWLFLGFFYLGKKAVDIDYKEIKDYFGKKEKIGEKNG